MASGITNKGRYHLFECLKRSPSLPSTYYIAAITGDVVPDADTATFSELTEIAAGNGYTSGGIALSVDSTSEITGFDTLTQDDVNDRAVMEIEDIVWTASGGNIPSSGSGARYVVLTDDNVTVSSREVYAWFDLGTTITISNGQVKTLQNLALRALFA